jgi:cardiolipin synthase C
VGSAIEFLLAGYRLNHRMHNKAWIGDGELLIGGGRNIGDAYFDASSQFNFRDLDLAVTGPAVSQATAVFERYWTDRRVRPIERIAVSRPRPNGLEVLRQTLATTAESTSSAAYLERVRALPELTELLTENHIPLAADKIRIIADPPGKRLGRRRPPGVLGAIRNTLGSAQKQVILVSPYFVPGRRGSRLLINLLRRGVAVSILTNSLAATDVLAVHGGYARYRRRLLKAGVELHELKRGGQEGKSMLGSGGASLHTKAFVTDDAVTFVGSFNLDPRSANLNTEMGAFVEGRALAGQLREEYRRLTDPARSWLVELESHRLTWRGHVEGHVRMLHIEPDTALLRRLLARMFGWLPIEPQL